MRQAEVDNLVAAARAKGRSDVDDLDVCCFLGAKEILRDSQLTKHHAAAKQVVNEFVTWMETGQKWNSFARFLIPVEFFETDEEKGLA